LALLFLGHKKNRTQLLCKKFHMPTARPEMKDT
jgi:hypothetical protein